MTKVKICGLSRQEDIDAVNRSLPDFIGFVFAESRRQVDAITAAKLKKRLDSRIRAVGVFVNQDISYIANLCHEGIIDMVQLHGDEDGGYVARLRKGCSCPMIKSIGIEKSLPVLPKGSDYLLFDSASQARGGTGKAFDWNILKGYTGLPYFLAGGLDISNVNGAINRLSPFCLDVSSGVETTGIKDAKKIDTLVRLIRGMK